MIEDDVSDLLGDQVGVSLPHPSVRWTVSFITCLVVGQQLVDEFLALGIKGVVVDEIRDDVALFRGVADDYSWDLVDATVIRPGGEESTGDAVAELGAIVAQDARCGGGVVDG